MAVSSIKDFWIHPNALTITLNYFGDPQLIQTSMLAGAVIMAYRKDVISYDAAHNFREWKLQAFPTQLNDTCVYYVHAELSRSGDTAMIIYSPVKRDIEGRSFIDGAWDNTTSTESFFIYLGTISASVDNDGATVERAWTDGFYTGTLDTDQQRMEEASGEWKTMFALNSVTGLIDVLKTISSATINALTVAKSLIFGGKTLTDVAGTGDTLDQSKVNDATIPTTGYTKKYVGDEIAVLDDHFLIKDDPSPQSVSGPVTFEKDVTVKGDHTVEGTQTLHEGFRTPSYVEQGDLIQGAQVTKEGIASFAKVKTPSMQVYELTLNRKTAVQGEYVFSDGETIEEVTQLDDDTYQLRVREPYEGYVTTFKVDDILYSNINMLDAQAHTGKCWMFATAIEGDTITAKMYPAEQCPSKENIAPIPHMTITRHGNRKDETRQDLFVISSETSSLTMLRGVNEPIVSSEGLYGVVLGKLPSTLLDYIKKGGYEYVNGEDPYVYARGVIVQDLIMLDYQGKPIRQERYRGHWSAEVATTNPYQSSATAYDTVTHNGSLWQCMMSGTKAEPKEGIADWLIKVAKGDDATASIYELVPSANIIYYRTAEKTLSVSSIDVKVGETTAHGYVEIADQYILEERGLKVSYAIDGKGDRTDLNISPVAAYLLEDGTAILATEEGFGLSLEGEDIDINAIEDNITLYLTDTTTDEDMSTYVIPVVKDGAQVGNNILFNSAFDEFEGESESDMLKHWDMTSDMAMLILSLKDLDGIYNAARVLYGGIKQYVSLTDKRSYTFSVYVKPAPTCQIIYRTNTASDVVVTSKQGTIKETTTDTYKAITFTPDVPSNEYTLVSMTIHSANYASQDAIELTGPSGGALYACPKLEEGSVATTYSKAVSELTGKAGKRGRMLYPAGDYADDVTYKIENNSAPFVREGETYYVLEWEEGEVSGIKPSEDYAKNGGHWKPFTYMNYLFAEFLMANWAHFGSNNGAVFYDRYLFSQQGNVLDANGYLSAEDASYGSYKDKMFDENGNLTNKGFIPNVSINFATGEVDTSRLNERYYTYDTNVQRIEMNKVHNIAVTPTAGVPNGKTRFGGSGPLIILPQSNVSTGAHVSIVANLDGGYISAYEESIEGTYNLVGLNYLVSTFSLVSADNIIINPTSATTGHYINNWFIWRGMRAKYIMLASGYTLNLRLQTVGEMNYWNIENSSDFIKINAQMFITTSINQGSYNSLTYDSAKFTRIKFYNNASQADNWVIGNKTDSPYSPIMIASSVFGNYENTSSFLGKGEPSIVLSTYDYYDEDYSALINGWHYRLVDYQNGGDSGFPQFHD